ncbi:hypothetical protein T02_12834 [Trichinella nativa]|uniref:Uncharacterized protein n=2 Tax=Trichinella TaxID=6333 RepID=A0A0V1LQU5_9BILA|nr:hypothetical protein T03_14274 [Trichinella britovi]KRZ61812.1 hypothetical protein T02_12834 [Trichinella nativa]
MVQLQGIQLKGLVSALSLSPDVCLPSGEELLSMRPSLPSNGCWYVIFMHRRATAGGKYTDSFHKILASEISMLSGLMAIIAVKRSFLILKL